MTAILRSMSLSLITIAIFPASQSLRGQDSPATTTLSDVSHQPQQPTGSTPNSQQSTTTPASTTPATSTLDTTLDAVEMDDGIEQPRRRMTKWNEYSGPHVIFRAGLGFLVDTASYA